MPRCYDRAMSVAPPRPRSSLGDLLTERFDIGAELDMAQHRDAVEAGDETFTAPPVVSPRHVCADRQIAASAEGGEKRPLPVDCGATRVVLNHREELPRRVVVVTALRGERTLGDLRQDDGRLERLGDVFGELQPLQRRRPP